MKRLIEKTVFWGFVTAWRLATVPTSLSPDWANATTEGVVRPPSAFSMTVGSPPSSTAMQLLVVPRSIPIVFPISALLLFSRKSECEHSRSERPAQGGQRLSATRICPRERFEIGRCGLLAVAVVQQPVVIEGGRIGGLYAGPVVTQVKPQRALHERKPEQVAIGLAKVACLGSVVRDGRRIRLCRARPAELGHPQRQVSVAVVGEFLLISLKLLGPGEQAPVWRGAIWRVVALLDRDPANVIALWPIRACFPSGEAVGVQRDSIERSLAMQVFEHPLCEGQDRERTVAMRRSAEADQRAEQQLQMEVVMAVDGLKDRVVGLQQSGVCRRIHRRLPLPVVVGLDPALVVGDDMAVAQEHALQVSPVGA